MRKHLEVLAGRGNREAIALLKGPDFHPCFAYLFEWFAELLLWCDDRPTWREIAGWYAVMQHPVTPWELRALRQVSDAFFGAKKKGESRGD